uniref:Uncharacterized protein n=1 Tax=Steinernema glaseri TaxID=37863 RepID=A0A1I8AH39_9BILA
MKLTRAGIRDLEIKTTEAPYPTTEAPHPTTEAPQPPCRCECHCCDCDGRNDKSRESREDNKSHGHKGGKSRGSNEENKSHGPHKSGEGKKGRRDA